MIPLLWKALQGKPETESRSVVIKGVRGLEVSVRFPSGGDANDLNRQILWLPHSLSSPQVIDPAMLCKLSGPCVTKSIAPSDAPSPSMEDIFGVLGHPLDSVFQVPSS